jgi:hypothetical protein
VIFRAILTYHPHVGTFRGGRGAWRVAVCCPDLGMPTPIEVIKYYPGMQKHLPVKALRMPVSRRLVSGTWINPTKLLRELFARQRINTLTKEKAA